MIWTNRAAPRFDTLDSQLLAEAATGGALSGLATTNVNVNDQMAYRRGEFYDVPLSINNSSAAQWQSVTNRAVQSGTINSSTGNLFLPKTPEVFSYDADGNLTNDGRWAYVWDGENRLLSMTAPITAPAGSVKALAFTYDAQSRRTSKIVSNYSGGSWTRVLHEKYLYDGWNLLGALNGTNNAVLRTYLWGSDLSGSLQGAGGVAGLLEAKVLGGNVAFACYDGNGNVAGLMDAASGSLTAQYEYGPFGEVIRCSGNAAKGHSFRFSTKYQDDESDYLYYGYRYYSGGAGRWPNRDPLGDEAFRNEMDLVQTPRRQIKTELTLYSFVSNDPLGRFDVLGLGEGILGIPGTGGTCCNKSSGTEWGLVAGKWVKLPPGQCTSWSVDCDGMTCGGGFYYIRDLSGGTCTTPGCDSPPFDNRRWSPGGGDPGGRPAGGPGGRGSTQGNAPPGYNYGPRPPCTCPNPRPGANHNR